MDTASLELGRGRQNVACSGEMLRYAIEHRLRRQLASPQLTLRHESVGEQTGLDTLVVHTLNDVYSLFVFRNERPSESVK